MGKLKGYYENCPKTRYHKLKIGLYCYIHDLEERKLQFKYISEIFHHGPTKSFDEKPVKAEIDKKGD